MWENKLFAERLDVVPPARGREMRSFGLASRRVFNDEQNQQDGDGAEDGRHAQTPVPRPPELGRLRSDDVTESTAKSVIQISDSLNFNAQAAEIPANRDGKVKKGQELGASITNE